MDDEVGFVDGEALFVARQECDSWMAKRYSSRDKNAIRSNMARVFAAIYGIGIANAWIKVKESEVTGSLAMGFGKALMDADAKIVCDDLKTLIGVWGDTPTALQMLETFEEYPRHHSININVHGYILLAMEDVLFFRMQEEGVTFEELSSKAKWRDSWISHAHVSEYGGY